MPVLSSFHGIIIKMYFLQSEHNPPHIHAIYNEDAAAVNFMTGEIIDGKLPAKTLLLLREWMDIHRETIKKIWDTQEFQKIPPLK